MAQRIKELDRLYEFGLILLGILASAEFEYILMISSEEFYYHAFKTFTVPFVILILGWLLKELARDVIPQKMHSVLTDFCWAFWSNALFFYVFILIKTDIWIYVAWAFSFILFVLIRSVYDRTLCLGLKDRGLIWMARLGIFFITYCLFMIIIL